MESLWARNMLLSYDKVYSVYIAEVDGGLKRNLLEGLQFIDWKKYVKKDSVVFIKPNFTFPHYKEGVTTSPDITCMALEEEIHVNQLTNIFHQMGQLEILWTILETS